MLFEYVIDVSIAVFAVFGFLCAVHMLAELFFAPTQLSVAVEVRVSEDAEMLDMLLREAASSSLRRGRARLVVLLSADLMDGTVGEDEELLPNYQEIIDRWGAECYLIDP